MLAAGLLFGSPILVAPGAGLLGLVAEYFRRMARAEALPSGGPSDFDAAFLRHQMAGGTMTTMRRQLAELGLAHRFDEMIDEASRKMALVIAGKGRAAGMKRTGESFQPPA